ncbi:branched-chain amino acid ABC transporter permease [Zhengella mangrovi]|uniref:Branched-chain amino acid ABC transporter permease n=1 Tax=Zhengella mangrovi TaxID=1982044 RepID=A0A2G1QJZ4_9HYPH|nr:branched-chain amino acid ABC transporter permease [Zhengella mangrovi]PHP65781.1 branched-chain amino acid ABC transporter permease [Zhengella mangrovi]
MIDYRRRMRANLAIAVIGLVLFAVFPLVANSGLVFLAGLVAVNIVFGLSWNLLFSGVGLLSFGHAMFFAGGAYAMAVVSLRLPDLPFAGGLLLGAMTGGIIALVFGYIALRRASGVYFAVLTLAFSELVHIVITKTTFLGRNDGLVGIPRPVINLGVASIDLTSALAYYYFIIVAMAVVAFALWSFQNSPAGRLIQAIRQDPVRTAFLGTDVRSWQLTAFVLSGTIAAFCGAVMVPFAQIASPEIAYWTVSTEPILFTLLGGAGHFWGPAVGAILFGAIDYATRALYGLSEITVGMLLLGVVLLMPGGLLGFLLSRRTAARRLTGSGKRVPMANAEKAT